MMQKITNKSVRHKVHGFTLIEILITVIILAIGLLGLAGLQLNGLRANHSAYLRSQATILTTDIIDRMLINKSNINSYAIATGTMPTERHCDVATPCDPTPGLVNADQYEWKDALENSLPSGDGSVTIVGSFATVMVQWDDSKGQNDPVQLTTEFQFQD